MWDPEISIVVFRELTCEQPELWLAFDAVEGEEIWVQLGMPAIDRLADHRPALAVLAPGLPNIDAEVPFDVPQGLGGVVYLADGEPQEFYEPFTKTNSWILAGDWVSTP